MLAEEIKRIREERGLGMTKIAQRSGLSRSHLYALEAGRNESPYVDTLIKLSKGMAIWQDGEPNDADWGELFRRLERAAGYPVDTSENGGSVPSDLDEQLRRISENWNRLGGQERSVVNQLLKMASSFCPSAEDTVGHGGLPRRKDGQQNSLALYLDWPQGDPLRTAHAPIRELAFAGA